MGTNCNGPQHHSQSRQYSVNIWETLTKQDEIECTILLTKPRQEKKKSVAQIYIWGLICMFGWNLAPPPFKAITSPHESKPNFPDIPLMVSSNKVSRHLQN